MDLDQAMFLERTPNGYIVHYAIADVAAFVLPSGRLDEETHRRGETLYFPDARVPLHPTVLSENAASLLPDQVRPAVLWRIDLNDATEITAVDVRRARVRSRGSPRLRLGAARGRRRTVARRRWPYCRRSEQAVSRWRGSDTR